MGGRPVRVVSRASPLARAQTDECLRSIAPVLPPGRLFETCFSETPGDRDKLTPLGDPSVPDDFFTRDLDLALLEGRADLAVHSAKDLPRRLPGGLVVACLLPARDPRDVLVVREGADPYAPPRRIGVSSPRREAALRRLYPDALQLPLRGTIGERLVRLDRGEFDAVVVAACALERLGFSGRAVRPMPWETTPLQGHLALVCRDSEPEWTDLLKPLDFRMRLMDAPVLEPPVEARAPIAPSCPAMLFTGTNPRDFERFGPLIPWPAIALHPAPRADRIRAIGEALDSARGVLFASAYSVRCFVDALFHTADARRLRGKALLAAGPATAEELERMGFHADAVATGWDGLASLAGRLDSGLRGAYFYPCSTATPAAERARMLADSGVAIVPRVFYETLANNPGPLPDAPFDRVLFTSPSAVGAYFRFNPGERTAARRWLAIGPSTRRALEEMGLGSGVANIEHRTSNIERRTPDIERELNVQHPSEDRSGVEPVSQHSTTPTFHHAPSLDPRTLNPESSSGRATGQGPI